MSSMAADPTGSKKLLQTIPGAILGMRAGVPAPIAHPDAKRSLYVKTGAMAVDMESHIVGAVAAAHGISFAAMRGITDPATRPPPRSGLAALGTDGPTHIRAVLRSIPQTPRHLPALPPTAL